MLQKIPSQGFKCKTYMNNTFTSTTLLVCEIYSEIMYLCSNIGPTCKLKQQYSNRFEMLQKLIWHHEASNLRPTGTTKQYLPLHYFFVVWFLCETLYLLFWNTILPVHHHLPAPSHLATNAMWPATHQGHWTRQVVKCCKNNLSSQGFEPKTYMNKTALFTTTTSWLCEFYEKHI
jgi:hypothetical protein